MLQELDEYRVDNIYKSKFHKLVVESEEERYYDIYHKVRNISHAFDSEEIDYLQSKIIRQEYQLIKLRSTNYQLLMELEKHLPHKILFKNSLLVFLFFSFCFLINIFFNTPILTPFWNTLGLFFSFGFIVMSILLKQDYLTLLKTNKNKSK